MSLQVWLPLDGDLRNQGLDGSGTFRNNSAVWGDGKIGSKAYLTSTGTNTTTFSSLVGVKEFSIAYWLKIDSSLTFSNYQDFWQVYYTNKTGTGPIRDEHNSTAGGHQLLVYKETDVGSNTHGYWACSTSSANNVWLHIVLTKDATQTKTYCNGVLKQTQDNTVYESSTGSLTGDVRIGNTTCGAYLNDFRIYDHVLSVKEIKELAKGLVLHYPLDIPQTNLLNGNKHLAANWTADGITLSQNDDGSLKLVSTAANKRIYASVTDVWVQDKKYTVTLEARSDTAGITIDCSRSIAANNFTEPFVLSTSWQKFKGIINCTATVSGGTLSIRVNQSGQTVYIRNVKLEEGEKATGFIPPSNSKLYAAAGYASGIVYDCSGYQNNGTEVGTITGSSDTPRYRSSSKFSNSSYITYQLPSTMYYATYSFWLKFSSFTAYGAINMQTSNPAGGNGPWFSCNTEGAQLWAYFGGNSPNYTKARYGDLLTNTWYHCVYVWDNGVTQWYLNGEKSGNATTYTDKKYISNSTTATIGNSYTGSNWNGTPFDGQLSDFRIYATALSAEDIKALYNESASIDKNGNFHAYEYVEDDSIIKVDINKQGVFTAPEEIIEDDLKEPSIDNKNIYAKGGFYED